ncbi:hypothetical protein, partial [Bacillus subtilis]|uniref:hypothetical protein n=1 Tax=Bacillus subtilis TaxID=1423 RepID=UPI001CFA3965
EKRAFYTVYLEGIISDPSGFFVTYLDFSLQQKQRKDAVMRQQPLLICKKRDEAASAHFIKANDSVHIIDRRILLQVTWLCEGSRVQL